MRTAVAEQAGLDREEEEEEEEEAVARVVMVPVLGLVELALAGEQEPETQRERWGEKPGVPNRQRTLNKGKN